MRCKCKIVSSAKILKAKSARARAYLRLAESDEHRAGRRREAGVSVDRRAGGKKHADAKIHHLEYAQDDRQRADEHR